MRTARHHALGLALCVWTLTLVGPVAAAGHGAWEHIDDADGIHVWKLEIPGQDMPGFRGQTFIRGRIEDIMKQMFDWKHHTQWMYRCSESTLLKQVNDNQAIMYNRTDAPWPISDRDVILDTHVSETPDKSAATVTFRNTKSDLKPVPEHVVRMPRLIGFYKMWQVEPGRVKVMYQVEADIGGNIPSWLAARSAKDLPYITLLKLRERVEGAR
jgi:hypothetical protein